MMTHPGRMVNHQSASSCTAWLRVHVLGGCRARGRRRAILQHTPRLSSRVVEFRRLGLSHLPATPTYITVFVAITRVTVHLVDTDSSIYMYQAHSHQCFRIPFLCSSLPSRIQKRNCNCNPCAHRHSFRAGRNCGHQRRNRLFAHRPIHDGEYSHCITDSGTNQHHSVRGSIRRKLVTAMELQRLQVSYNIQLRSRVVGDQNANHVLIPVRHRFGTSPWVLPRVNVLHTVRGNFSQPFSGS